MDERADSLVVWERDGGGVLGRRRSPIIILRTQIAPSWSLPVSTSTSEMHASLALGLAMHHLLSLLEELLFIEHAIPLEPLKA